eukprot:Sspe_Gene.91952::Locus_63616_Transcript_1_1_Confidence_1.000_Length_1531::g.91952::m.91952
MPTVLHTSACTVHSPSALDGHCSLVPRHCEQSWCHATSCIGSTVGFADGGHGTRPRGFPPLVHLRLQPPHPEPRVVRAVGKLDGQGSPFAHRLHLCYTPCSSLSGMPPHPQLHAIDGCSEHWCDGLSCSTEDSLFLHRFDLISPLIATHLPPQSLKSGIVPSVGPLDAFRSSVVATEDTLALLLLFLPFLLLAALLVPLVLCSNLSKGTGFIDFPPLRFGEIPCARTPVHRLDAQGGKVHALLLSSVRCTESSPPHFKASEILSPCRLDAYTGSPLPLSPHRIDSLIEPHHRLPTTVQKNRHVVGWLCPSPMKYRDC